MALGGGTWLVQNKVLPGSYINFSSVAKASATLSDRGYAAAPFVLSWGPENEVFAVTSGEFQKNSKAIFGYSYDHPKMLALREIFLHATTVYCYRLGLGAKRRPVRWPPPSTPASGAMTSPSSLRSTWMTRMPLTLAPIWMASRWTSRR